LHGLYEEIQGGVGEIYPKLIPSRLDLLNIVDGQHRIAGIRSAMKDLNAMKLGDKTRTRIKIKPTNMVYKKRQATKSVARLDNTRRSNVSEWSNHNNNR